MAMHLGSTVGIGVAGEVVVLVSICERVSFRAGKIAEDALDRFPVYATSVKATALMCDLHV